MKKEILNIVGLIILIWETAHLFHLPLQESVTVMFKRLFLFKNLYFDVSLNDNLFSEK